MYQVIGPAVSVGQGDTFANAACEPGDVVLGGGHTFSPFLNLNHYNWDAHLIQEIAYGTNTNQQGWRVYVWSNTAPDPLFDVRAQSYAMCAQVAP